MRVELDGVAEKGAGQKWLIAAALVALALGLRLLFFLKIQPGLGFGDQDEYLAGARRLLAHEPLAVRNWMLFVRAPGYSLFIAAVWWLTGSDSQNAVRVAQAILSTGTCVYIYLLGRRLSKHALLGLAMAAVYPYFIYQCGLLGTEAAFSFFVIAGVYHLGIGLGDPPRLRQVVVASVMLALGNLLRPNLSTFLPFVGLWLLWRWRRSPLQLVKVGVALAIPILAITLPWTFSVHRQGLGWIWVTDGAPAWYYMGHTDETHQIYCGNPTPQEEQRLMEFPGSASFTKRPAYRKALAAPPGQQQAVFMKEALAWDRAHLDWLPCLMVKKLWGYWRPWVNPATYGLKLVLVSAASLPVLVLGLLCLGWAWQSGERVFTVLTAINIVTGTVVAVLFSTEIRYRIPIVDVLLLPYSGCALGAIWEKVRNGKR